MMKNKIFKTMLVMLLILSVLAVFTACSKDGADNAQDDGTTADAGGVQNSSNKAKSFDMHKTIVSLDGKTVYKDVGFDDISFVLLDESTNKEEVLFAIKDDSSISAANSEYAKMFLTSEKLYYTLYPPYEYFEVNTLYSYDFASKKTEKIMLSQCRENFHNLGVFYIDDTYIYYSGIKEENLNNNILSTFKYNIKTGQVTEFLPDDAYVCFDRVYADSRPAYINDEYLTYYVSSDNYPGTLYIYNFDDAKSYKIADNACFTHAEGGRIFYATETSDSTEIYSCTLSGSDTKFEQRFDGLTGYLMTNCGGCGDFVYFDDGYIGNLKDGTYTEMDNDDLMFYYDKESIYAVFLEENAPAVYVWNLYDISDGVTNKKRITKSDAWYDLPSEARVKDGKLYYTEQSDDRMTTELKIIPLK